MESIARQKLRESISDAREIRLECLKSFSNINLIHERAVRLYFNLCLIFDRVSAPPDLVASRRTDIDSMAGPERDALLERARQTLPPKSQNDADAVMIAALEMLTNGTERDS